jgi:hypothetical protein
LATDATAAAFFMSSGWRGAELWSKVGNFESWDELLQRWGGL